MPMRRTQSRRLSGGTLKQYTADLKAAREMNMDRFQSGDRFYERGEDNKYRCVENCGKPRLSQSKAAKAERKSGRVTKRVQNVYKRLGARARAGERRKSSAANKLAAKQARKERPCPKPYQTRNPISGRCEGRKVRVGPRGGQYVLKGGKKVYL